MALKINYLFYALLLVGCNCLVYGQSINTTSSHSCSGIGEAVFFIMGGDNCQTPLVQAQADWSVTPSAGVTITYVQSSTNPVNYNSIRVNFSYPGNYTINANYTCPGGIGGSATPKTFDVHDENLPTLEIISDRTLICSDGSESVRFEAIASETGASPIYSWRINNEPVVGPQGPVFTTSDLPDGAEVSAWMNSSLPCTAPVASENVIQITTRPVTEATLHLTAASGGSGCTQTSKAFIVNGQNIGPDVTWIWKIGDNQVQPSAGTEMNVVFYDWNYPDNTTIQCIATTSGACSSPNPVYSNILTVPLNPPAVENFGVSITVEPFRYPAIYCADEVTFVANTSHPATVYWYKNGENVHVGQSYDPVYYHFSDIITAKAIATTHVCLDASMKEATLDKGFFKIDEPVGPVEIHTYESGRCQGPGETAFFAVAENAKSFIWHVSPTVGTITGVDERNSSVNLNWSNFAGNATITVQANGCNNAQTSEQLIHPAYALPIAPADATLHFCSHEAPILSSSLGENHNFYRWFKDDELLGESKTLQLPRLKAGQYTYKAELVDLNGCVSSNTTTFNVDVSGPSSPCDSDLHWIEATSFMRGLDGAMNVASKGRSYFSNLGKPIQEQSVVQSFNEAISSISAEDQYGRIALNSLTAPLGRTELNYNHWFAMDNEGKLIDHSTLGAAFSQYPNTVGEFYGINSKESKIAVSSYPFSQVEYYNDGYGEVRQQAAPGDVHRMGQGREIISGTFPVFFELEDYLEKRDQIFSGSFSPVSQGMQAVSRDENGVYNIVIYDANENAIVTMGAGGSGDIKFEGDVVSSTDPLSEYFRPFTYFYILESQDVSIDGSGSYHVENILTGERRPANQSFADSNGLWPPGFYRIILLSGQVTLHYYNHYKDIAYQFYDDLGNSCVSISPNGLLAWMAGEDFENIDKTRIQYNQLGKISAYTSADAGTTTYLYRRDGKIRFSQSALQRLQENDQSGRGIFSYTNYDSQGRPTESGEYTGDNYSYSGLLSVLESETHFDETEKAGWVKTIYDEATSPGGQVPNLPESFRQEYLTGAVSSTFNVNNQTWYSYDEFGRIVWMAQKPARLERTFLTQYTYDFLGNVLTVFNGSYTAGEQLTGFYHHYEYDKDQRLKSAFTSTNGSDLELRAKYEYYLHGPLKRIELGDNLQGIDFVYNIHGWLTQINHPDNTQDPGGDSNDVFGMILDYYESDLVNLYHAGIGPKTKFNFHEINSPQSLASHIPLIRFTIEDELESVEPPFRKFSAGSPMYREMFSESNTIIR